MKQTSFIFLAFLLSSCKPETRINEKCYDQYIGLDKCIVVSCFRCGCVNNFVKKYSKIRGIKQVKILADSTCINEDDSINYTHMDQSKLDSVYLKNYNIVLFKRDANGVVFRILKTEEEGKFFAIVQDFFF